MDKIKTLILALYDMDAVKFGSFTLKSGIQSPIYFDLRVIISHPEIMQTISEILEDVVSKKPEIDVICGVPYTALPLATIVSVRKNIPMIIKRKEQKKYGTAKLIEGKYIEGKTKCLILEDVVTTGSSIIETAQVLRDHGIIVNHSIVVLNRNFPAVDENLKSYEISVESIIKVNQLLQVLLDGSRITQAQKMEVEAFLANDQTIPKNLQFAAETTLSAAPAAVAEGNCEGDTNNAKKARLVNKSKLQTGNAKLFYDTMVSKQSNLCLSADCENWQQVLRVTDVVGSKICAVKTHLDAINFEDSKEIESFKEQLTNLAKKHNFVIIEDRKFADIGSTVEKQLLAKPFVIAEWARFVTVHAIPGPGMLKVFRELQLGVILIAEMSSAGNIPSVLPEYKTKALEMCTGYEDTVVGFVSQSRVGQSMRLNKQPLHDGNGDVNNEEDKTTQSYLQFTPGVSLNATGDSLGQQYVSVQDAVLCRDADVVIVGRGIIKQPEDRWNQVAEEYRKQGWDAFQQKINAD